MLLLDTSAVSALMHRDGTCLDRLRVHPAHDVALCAPVAAEISFGLHRLAARSRRRRLLRREYDLLRASAKWFDWTEGDAEHFGVLKARLQAAGVTVDDFDLAIASIALRQSASVATRNVRHFRPIDGLDIEDWGADAAG